MIARTDDELADDLLASAGVIERTTPSLQYDEVFASLKIMDKRDEIVPFTRNRAQEHFAQHCTGRDLLLKARQLGFSTDIQGQAITRAVTSTIRCATLAHDTETTQKLRRMAERFYDNLPKEMRPPRGLDNATTTTYPETQSEVTIATAGAKNAGRGGTYNFVHGSEVAFWSDAKKIIAGLMQGVPEDGTIILESTPNGARGWFYQQCVKALNGEGIWTLHFYAWWWDDGYQLALLPGEVLEYTKDEQTLVDEHGLTPQQIKWRRAKEEELGDLFQQEYPEDPVTCFLASGRSAFGKFHHALYVPCIFEPDPTHEYMAGNDWGQDNDYTSLSIFDATLLQEVWLERWREMPFGVMRKAMIARCKYWGVKFWISEKNSAASNIEDLEKELGEEGLRLRLMAKAMSNPYKSELVVNFKDGLDTAGLKLLKLDYATQEMTAFVSGRTPLGLYTYAAATEEDHDDTVIARLLAYDAVLKRAELIPQFYQMKVKGR
jgi:hypothetical protein